MKLNPVAERFILHWGEMGSKWGVNRTVAQIHALLYLAARPMPADEIVETLGVARSNVSTSLRELQSWKLIQVVHVMGDRRDHFITPGDIWVLLRTIVRGRKEREFDPTVDALRAFLASPELAQESPEARQRIQDTLVLMESMSVWTEQMLRLEPETLGRVLKLGAKISEFLPKRSG
ncbi:MAG: MarR family transcriptional regulator [Gammaproteobacteria bacterium 28-57-27]|nr:MAG: MarR family transcriptional regulator [Gammaproteobacteria bacterium 28-57-27]